MSDTLASFRELKGIGPATEAKLHEAGVYSWAALAEVVSALGNVRGSNGDTLRELSDRIAARASEVGGTPTPHLPNGERSEAFILRMALTTEDQPIRCTVTHVRTQTEKSWASWSPGEVIGYIEEQSGVIGKPATGAPESAPVPVENTSKPPAPVVTPAASRDHVVVLDAGKAVGGSRRDLELVVSTARLAGIGEFEYQATLASRAFGHVSADWATLAGRAGHGHPPEDLPLRFEAVELTPGVQRLRLQLALRLASPMTGVPALELG